MRYLFKICLLLLCSFPAMAQNFPPALCDHAHLTVEWPKQAPVQLISSRLTFTSYADLSELQFKVRNQSSKPVTQIAALIEILGRGNRHLLTFAAHSVAPDFLERAPEVPAFFDPDNGGRLETVLYPGDTTDVVPSSPLVLPVCPSHARVTFLQVDAIQQPQFRYSAKDVRTDPVLKSQATADLSPFPVKGSYEQLLTIKINNKGTASLTSVEDYPDDLPAWLDRLLASWRFVPVNFNGIALQGEVNFLFRFHPRREPAWNSVMKYRNEEQPFIVVDIYPPSSQEDNVLVSVGHHNVNRNLIR